MQRSALERWIDSLTERAFDTPFIVLLRAHRFFDIHFTHGSYEFGKDFIAKRIENNQIKQFGFQIKAGDIGGSEWDSINGQMEELVSDWLAHPNYNSTLGREHRLVLTGTLKGKAILSTKQFAERLKCRQEGIFLVWDRDYLLDLLEGKNPSYPIKEPPAHIESLISSTTLKKITRRKLSVELDYALPKPASLECLRESLLHSSLLVAQLRMVGHHFNAVLASYNSVRLALFHYLEFESREAYIEYLDALQFSVDLGVETSKELLTLKPIDLFFRSGSLLGAWAAYPVTCFSILESLGLGALHARWLGDVKEAEQLTQACCSFIEHNPGCFHPISDRLAASLIPAVSALALGDRLETGELLIREITKWVCDKIENDFGLAGLDSEVDEEVARIFSPHFDFFSIQARKESLFAVALADLSYIFFPELYPIIINELKAVQAIPSMVHPLDTPEALFLSTRDKKGLLNIAYPDDA